MNARHIGFIAAANDASQITTDREQSIRFGPYLLLPQQHALFKNGERMALGSRAIHLLIAMASRTGELVEKSELMACAWPKVVVEECNLRTQILTLRRALSDDNGQSYIATVPGRGYRFVAPTEVRKPVIKTQAAHPTRSNLPRSLTELVGCENLVPCLGERVQSKRFLTITGAAGSGKSAVALAVAHTMAEMFPQGICFIDFAQPQTWQTIAALLASALDLPLSPEESLQTLIGQLADNKVLVILDSCDHALELAAYTAEILLRQTRHCCVLTTSREALHAEGEFVYRLAALGLPAENLRLSAAQALLYPGIRLFVDRVQAHDPGFSLRDDDVLAVCRLCRKLDTNPLAIEIVAARVPTFGIRPLTQMLDSQFLMSMEGRRTAQPRHRSLNAALEWSYVLLSAAEQALFCHLAAFSDSFTLDEVNDKVGAQALKPIATFGLLESLIAKSLLTVHEEHSLKRYRMQALPRAFALGRL